ncbi:hypothetical protein C0995_001454 [Termitomyces sp. Mi166|nr:hypothetical protein C0995_001454 [Termitomyces sp. Mi166\
MPAVPKAPVADPSTMQTTVSVPVPVPPVSAPKVVASTPAPKPVSATSIVKPAENGASVTKDSFIETEVPADKVVGADT